MNSFFITSDFAANNPRSIGIVGAPLTFPILVFDNFSTCNAQVEGQSWGQVELTNIFAPDSI